MTTEVIIGNICIPNTKASLNLCHGRQPRSSVLRTQARLLRIMEFLASTSTTWPSMHHLELERMRVPNLEYRLPLRLLQVLMVAAIFLYTQHRIVRAITTAFWCRTTRLSTLPRSRRVLSFLRSSSPNLGCQKRRCKAHKEHTGLAMSHPHISIRRLVYMDKRKKWAHFPDMPRHFRAPPQRWGNGGSKIAIKTPQGSPSSLHTHPKALINSKKKMKPCLKI